MQIIRDLGIQVVSLDDIITGKVNSEFSVALTFDDGHSSDLSVVAPILKGFNFPATFFIPVIRKAGKRLTDDQVKELSGKHSFCIGSHGLNHLDLTRLASSEVLEEVTRSKEKLQELSGQPVDHFAFPYGLFNREVIQCCLSAGYKTISATGYRLNDAESGQELIFRWSVPFNTDLKRFQEMITPGSFESRRAIFLQPFKQTARMLIGRKTIDALNVLFH
jgi:peptidoglycan/xylan/chitin deacetylase (PgdA/CDA1 family)